LLGAIKFLYDMVRITKYIRLLIWISIPIIILSCQETVKPEKIDYPTAIQGTWTITQSFATNGPICFFLEVGDKVEFEVNLKDSILYFNYNTGKQQRRDSFNYEISYNEIICSGEYSTSSHVEPIFVYDEILPYHLNIIFLSDNKIECYFRMGTISPYTNEVHIGDISHFIARKK